MATSSSEAEKLPRFIVIKSTYYYDKGYAYSNDAGFVLMGEESAFSMLVKIEAERASDDRYVHLRFCNSNRYWARKGRFIVAESNKREEDTTKPSCTLFEAIMNAGGNGRRFYLNHVQSGGRLLLDNASIRFYVEQNPGPTQGYLNYVNWDTFVKLPERVAFKGYSGKFLAGVVVEGYNYLQFSFNDPNAVECEHEVHLMNDGHVRIKSKHFDRFWRREPNWIWADSTDTTPNNKDTLFWPVKIDNTTIALRSAGNNYFCKGLTTEGKIRCLNAAAPKATNDARFVVQELVLGRKIFNVRYLVENARIFNEETHTVGTTTAFNHSDTPIVANVEVSYQNTVTQTFSRSFSLTAGVTITFEASVPYITKDGIKLGLESSTTLQLTKTTTMTETATVKGTVTVPARHSAIVNCVGTKANCDVPFSYTQEDRSSNDERIILTDHIDGVFRGFNAYNFSLVVDKFQPLSQEKTGIN